MSETTLDTLPEFLTIFICLAAIGLICILLLLIWVLWRVKKLNIPQDADFITTLQYTPLSVVILLDLLDMTFDLLAAPFAWVLLTYLNLQALRGVTVIEALIPGTQFIPVLTGSWLLVRLGVLKSSHFSGGPRIYQK